MRRLTLEQRIARLERLLIRKNESASDFNGMLNAKHQEGRRALDVDGEEVTIVRVSTFKKLYYSGNSWEQYDNREEMDDYAEEIKFNRRAWDNPAALIRYDDGTQLLCADPGEYLEII